MRWIYLLIGIFASIMIAVFFFHGPPDIRSEGIRVSVTTAVVNLALFRALSWAKKRGRDR